jgi:hypothetical protein
MELQTRYPMNGNQNVARRAVARIAGKNGLVTVCASCKRIRDQRGWTHIHISCEEHSDTRFSHGLCPSCLRKLYPEISKRLRFA